MIERENCLAQPVTVLKGIGKERAAELANLGIQTIGDLLFYFPYRYEDQRIRDLAEAAHDERVTVLGTVHSEASLRFYGGKKSRLTVKVLIDRYLVTAVLFNRPFAKNQFHIGRKVRLTGKFDRHRLQITVDHYAFVKENQSPARHDETQGLVPVYSAAGKVSSLFIRKLVQEAFKQYGDYIPEILPKALIQKYKLMPRKQAIKLLHAPLDYQQGKLARRRMVFEELFLFQLKLAALKKVRRENQRGQAQQIDHKRLQSFINNLPFTLTDAQRKALKEIIADLQSPFSMSRLLQGDVGSGKTVVAALSLFASFTAGFQGALMVPTEILAEQHYQYLEELFKQENMQIALLTGSTRTRERRSILAGLQMGTIDVLVGTHALIQEEVFFKQLGLIIIDEQHRFGVEQRRALRQKGLNPDVLFMTATPIPRTLAITAIGDMDVSVIDQLPVGRKPVETYWVKPDMLARVIQFIAKEVAKGRQAYFICPLIEESEKLDVQNAIDTHAMLSKALPQCKIGLIHGRLSNQEKETVMQQFATQQLDVLVATTVIEVGVNVPNASLMVIQDADRFGLAQLHQLRGRVGRGKYQSYCILIADPKTETGRERMQILKEVNSGFELAEKDLQLRGPGDFFGKKQSGLPEFRLADVVHDYRALEVARREAFQLIHHPPFWTEAEFEPLRQFLSSEGVLDAEKLD